MSSLMLREEGPGFPKKLPLRPARQGQAEGHRPPLQLLDDALTVS
jgi:hypothetical protein